MRLAIPVLGEEIAPRFCFAQRLLLVDLEGGQETGRTVLDVGSLEGNDRLRLLAERHVTFLCCSGINKLYLPFSQGLGICVSWGHNGSVEEILARLLRGELPRVPASVREAFDRELHERKGSSLGEQSPGRERNK
jgi:predicted Fe-Mo cluster-binding NifX family protein